MPSDPTSDERLRKAVLRGQQLLEKEAYHDVVTWCQKVLAVYPDQPEILKQLETAQGALNKRLLDDIFSLAERALSQGDYDAALEQFQKVFDVDPENARAKERIAQINAMKEGSPAGGIVPPAGGIVPPAGGSAPPGGGGAPPAQPSKEAAEQPFGINVDDPFALGDEAAPPAPQEAPPAPAPEGQAEASGAEAVPTDAGAGPGASKELEIVDDISDALLTSERMHEAAEAFGAEVVDKPPPGMDFVVDEEKSAEDAALEAELESAALEGAPPAEETTADGAPAPSGQDEAAPESFEISDAPAPAESPGEVEMPEPRGEEAAPSFELAGPEAPAESPGKVEMPEPQGGEAAPSLEPSEPKAPALEIDETPLELEEGGPPGKALSPEEQKHIEELSKKGDAYFERGQCQLAIDTWYQILLVDENNRAALRRIEKAKRELEMQGKKVTLDLPAQDVLETTDSAMTQEAMAEGPQQAIAALLEDAKKLLEAGQYAASAEKCEHIIQIEPGHQEANRLIHDANLKIQGQEPKEAAQEEAAPAEAVSPEPFTPVAQQEIKIAAPPSSRAPLLLIGLMAVLLLIGGGLAAFFMWFAKPAPVEEAQQVVAPKPKAPQPLPEPEPEPEPEPQVQSDAELLAARMEKAARLFKEAKAFFAKRKYAEAAAAIAESASLNPTNLEAIDFKEKADSALAASQEETTRYERALKSFKERNYEEALRQFYRMKEVRYYSRELQETVARGWYSLQVKPKEVDAYIEKSWYNRGIVSLWDENSELTIEALREYLLLRPDDAEARKHLTVAERYSRRPKDENYRQYVSFLKLKE